MVEITLREKDQKIKMQAKIIEKMRTLLETQRTKLKHNLERLGMTETTECPRITVTDVDNGKNKQSDEKVQTVNLKRQAVFVRKGGERPWIQNLRNQASIDVDVINKDFDEGNRIDHEMEQFEESTQLSCQPRLIIEKKKTESKNINQCFEDEGKHMREVHYDTKEADKYKKRDSSSPEGDSGTWSFDDGLSNVSNSRIRSSSYEMAIGLYIQGESISQENKELYF